MPWFVPTSDALSGSGRCRSGASARGGLALTAAFAALFAPLCVAQAAPQFTFTELTVAGATTTKVDLISSINDAGQVAGSVTSSTYTNGQAAIFSNGGASVSYPATTVSGISTTGTGSSAGLQNTNINSSGYFAGTYNNSAGLFVTTAGGAVTVSRPSALVSSATTYAGGINDSGQIVVNGINSSSNYVTYVTSNNGSTWTLVGGITSSPGFMNGTQAEAINNSGTVVGAGPTASGYTHAFENTPTAGVYATHATDLGTLAGATGTSVASAINASGQITGYSTVSGSSNKDVFFYSSGTMTDLGVLAGGYTSCTGYGINNAGWVVGGCTGSGLNAKAFLYEGTGSLIDLNSLLSNALPSGYWLSRADGINSSDQIVGDITNGTSTFAYELTVTVPEPGSLPLLAAGVAGLVLARCRPGRKPRVPA